MSNARRIGFTALALVAFAILVHRSYWLSCDYAYEALPDTCFSQLSWQYSLDGYSLVLALVVAGMMALAPILFLSLSISNKPRHVGSRWILNTGFLFFATLLIALWLGRVDAESCLEAYYTETETKQVPPAECPSDLDARERRNWQRKRQFYWVVNFRPRFVAGLSSVPQRHVVSWPWLLTWLLLPILLTTAFVIFGAWRRAVRDAEVGAVDEGELTADMPEESEGTADETDAEKTRISAGVGVFLRLGWRAMRDFLRNI